MCIYHYDNREDVSLFGGRIEIGNRYNEKETALLKVDGNSIVEISDRYIRESLSLSTVASHLNAIEANGVDSFIANYKQNIEFIYAELKELNQKTELLLSFEKEDSNINRLLSELEKTRNLLLSVLAVLFSLQTYMTAGLENEKVISVCQSIMDSLS